MSNPVHSLAHATFNDVKFRFTLFFASSAALIAITVRAARGTGLLPSALLCLSVFAINAGGRLFAQITPAVAATPAEEPPLRTLTAAEARADLVVMREALQTIHPGLYRRTAKAEIDRAFDALDAHVANGITDVELYRQISLLLAMIRCTHTKADQIGAMQQWRDTHASHLPLRFRLIEGRMIVVSSDPSQTPLRRGAEVLTINGRPVAELVSTLGAYIPIDGQTEASRAAHLADDGDLMGAGFDHFYPYLFGFPARFDLTLRDGDGTGQRTVSLSPITFRAWTKLASDGPVYRQDFSNSVSWKMLDSKTGYLRIDTFVNYRKPVDAAAVYARAIGDLRNAGAQALVLDLRENSGGSNDASLALIDALAAAPYTYQRAMRYRAVRYGNLPHYISSWGDREALFNPPLDRFTQSADGWFDLRPELAPEELQQRQPTARRFEGPVTVLSGPANASGATMVIAKLRDMDRVTVLGEPSGGSADGPTAGTILNVKLPKSGISVRIPLVFNQMEVDRFDPDGGIVPDVPVLMTIADFRAGRDRQVEHALAELNR